jgi:hypothetical protein
MLNLICIILLLKYYYIIKYYLLFLYYKYIIKSSCKKNKWIVLLTTCVNVENLNNKKDINERKLIYIKQINRWLNETNLPIFVVESSGYIFDEIKNNKLTVFSFKINKKLASSSQYEATSILYALDRININYTHVLKVTGRYFLPNIENILLNSKQDFDLYVQTVKNHFAKFQNSEYYGIRKKLLKEYAEYVKNNNVIMEHKLYELVLNHTFINIGPFLNDIPRGGDKLIIKYL